MLSANGKPFEIPTPNNGNMNVQCNLFFEKWREDKYDRLIIQIDDISPSLIRLFDIPSVLRGCGIESFTKKISDNNYRLEIQVPVEVKWEGKSQKDRILEKVESKNGRV